MEHVSDFAWKPGLSVSDCVKQMGKTGFQGIGVAKAADVILNMKKSGAKIFLTFTSNMVTSGLRGLFAQCIELGMVDAIVTTVGGIEEDIMKAHGEKFVIGDYAADDVELYEKGVNRIGNLYISNESYGRFEDIMNKVLANLFKKKSRWTVSEMLNEIGSGINDTQSILSQAAKKKIPIFCPAITDGSFGFHLYLFQQQHPDFIVDVVQDFKNILFCTSHDDKKGIIALGGGVSKHHAILSCLLNGGLDYAVYMTTAHEYSGSMGGATTREAKSWGKVKDEADAITVIGEVSITFPLVMVSVFDKLHKEGLIKP